MNRADMLARAQEPRLWDVLVIGGGATGVGIAVDAASRGYSTLLLEAHDFGKGASSRSTKLIHGGVRYLEQGNIALVREALRERGLLQQNAPHIVHDLAFIVPSYSWWHSPFYGLGLKVYSLFSGKYKIHPTRLISRRETLRRIPTLTAAQLRGGIVYYDGQFDDARLLIHLAATAADHGATLLNYAPVIALDRDSSGRIAAVIARDEESGAEFRLRARIVINAAGPFCDSLRRLADPTAPPLVAPSQGIHLVFDRSFLPGDSALMVPRTPDKRIMFAIPWHGRTLIGTTDTAIPEPSLEPVPTEHEIEFILETAGRYLAPAPARADILSLFAGIRPLVRAHAARTAALSREHLIHLDDSGLLTITGGKWTTYRNMAEDCIDRAIAVAGLEPRPCVTRTLRIRGWHDDSSIFGHLAPHGADAPLIRTLADAESHLSQPLHPRLPTIGAEITWAARHELARTVEDCLARRTRALFLDARAAIDMAPAVAALLARELDRSEAWQRCQVASFTAIARRYLPASM